MRRYDAAVNWTKVETHGNVPVNRFCAAHCVIDGKLFVSGGCRQETTAAGDIKNVFLSDAWTLEFEADGPVWCRLPSPPISFAPRFQHTATAVGDEVWLIGGSGEGRFSNDVFTFNIKTLEWRERDVRAVGYVRRFGHAAIVDPKEPHQILLFGGLSKPGSAPPPSILCALNTKTQVVVPVRTLGDVKIRRVFSIPFHASERRVLFATGIDINEETAEIKGIASFRLDDLHWSESHFTHPSLHDLHGARGFRIGRKIYIHAGKQKKCNTEYSSDIIEMEISQHDEIHKVRVIKSIGLKGVLNHVLFQDGEYVYACMGMTEEMSPGTELYRANLQQLLEVKTERSGEPTVEVSATPDDHEMIDLTTVEIQDSDQEMQIDREPVEERAEVVATPPLGEVQFEGLDAELPRWGLELLQSVRRAVTEERDRSRQEMEERITEFRNSEQINQCQLQKKLADQQDTIAAKNLQIEQLIKEKDQLVEQLAKQERHLDEKMAAQLAIEKRHLAEQMAKEKDQLTEELAKEKRNLAEQLAKEKRLVDEFPAFAEVILKCRPHEETPPSDPHARGYSTEATAKRPRKA